ncbi:glycosyltransferase [Roseospira marina]|uniref:Glycosyltransferase n=1 Tax=Roseospira marina TaxID=140057 RepID=A0A5M6IBY6_9PROT|nr:glycosyltransferase [Roseospira marina]KAA5605766.1 glycosyltransferase [Roseospira marina]MBB4313571.1 glycosyltransferase involved in cell wall biosynthesis [Roseospira marina]MBB5086733.1 glycosyltransferase involved in cell wall biosynthesis [Roseospira marina]
MTKTAVIGTDIRHAPGDARDWRLTLPAGDRLAAPGGARSITLSVLWAAWRQGVSAIAVRDAGGTWHEASPLALIRARGVRRLRTHLPGAATRAWRRVLATVLPVQGRADGPVVMVLPTLAGNGAERQMLMLTAGLVARGWPVRVLVKHRDDRPDAAALVPDLARLGVPVDVWTTPPAETVPALAALERATDGLPDAVAGDLLSVAGWLAVLKPRVVHAWLDTTAVVGGAAAAVLGVPRVVVGLRNQAPDALGHPLADALRPGLAALARHPAVTVTANARAVATDHQRWAGIAPPTVIPNGVRLPPPRPALDCARPLVLGVFRLVPHKRPLLWLAVAARIRARSPTARFRILGDGPLRDAVAAQARALGVDVELPGWAPDVASHRTEAAILLHVSRAEGLPNAVLEAQATGVPVVACDAGGTAEALPAGSLSTPDPDALADRVLGLLTNPSAWTQAANAGRAHAARFSVPALVARHERLYDTPPRAPDEARAHARTIRRHPAGLARSLVTVARLITLGEAREIAHRLGRRMDPPAVPAPPAPSRPTARPRAAANRPPRLAWIGETLARDGAPLSLWELTRGLTDAGHATPVLGLAFRDGPVRKVWANAGTPLRIVDPGRPLTAAHLERHVDRLARALMEAAPDVVIVNGLRAFAGVEAAARAGLASLWILREPGPEALADHALALQARAWAAFGRADRLVFVSHATHAAWAAHVPPDRSAVIPNAVPSTAWEPRPPTNERILMAAGALCPRKGPLDLVAALPLLPDGLQARVRVLWAGRDGDGYGHRVRRAIAALPDPLRDRVSLLGERDDMAALWATANLAVCPSHAEAAPRAVLEARRAGVPLVATIVGGIPEQAAHWPHTWLVPPGDPPTLARAISRALDATPPAGPPDDTAARYAAMVSAYAAALRALLEAPR